MGHRRQFIKQALAGSAAISFAGGLPQLLLGASRSAADRTHDRILVVLQLTGGNDGLNTVVPFGDDDYYRNRFTLAVGRQAVHALDDHLGLHPALANWKRLFQEGSLAIVQGVGYASPNRSHFESMDLWHTAHRLGEGRVGWLGRTVDQWPEGTALPALHLGEQEQPLALRNEGRPVPSVRSIDSFQLDALRDARIRRHLEPALQPARKGNDLLSYVHESGSVALATSHRLSSLGTDAAARYGYPGSRLGRDLSSIAQLIGSGLETRVYYATLEGFDTHANQAEAHSGLLTELNQAVSAFQNQLQAEGNDERVALFAFSEFGRRVRENASRGTDHGTAAPVFLVGTHVAGGIHGPNPDLADLDEGDLRFQIDYRQVYTTVLERWLEVDPQSIVGSGFSPLDLFQV